jgi:SNF2 family DNA or RNA helicase
VARRGGTLRSGLRVHLHDATTAKAGRPAQSDADVVVTSYGLLQHDEQAFAGAEWAVVVLDEAHS